MGDRYILERLSEQDWTLGGEASGHIICRDRTTTGDGIVSALQVLAEINKSGKPSVSCVVAWSSFRRS